MMLGFLLARAGVDVVVLEKHADFFRDFRGDTIHPSTLELMYELGLLDEFLKLPHQKLDRLTAQIGDERVRMIDLTHLPTHCKYIALMPQWDFLNFLAAHGKRYGTFHLRMQAEATDLIEEGGRVVGLRAETPDGELADPRRPGRRLRRPSFDGARQGRLQKRRLRRADGCAVVSAVAQSKPTMPETFGHVEAGTMMIMLDRGDYWQCAFVIPKGGIDRVQRGGPRCLRQAGRDDVAVPCRSRRLSCKAGTTSSF